MRDIIKQSVLIYLLLTVVTGIAYPLAVTAIAQIAWPNKANGSLITDQISGKVIGSELLGQEFKSDSYFWSRLSATSPPYNAAASSGSNIGPTNPALAKNMQSRIDDLKRNNASDKPIPVDLVTSSGSGLDPHISLSSAEYQAARVARARGLSEEDMRNLIASASEPRQLGFLGEARVNVLKLNIALDKLGPPRPEQNSSSN